MEKIKWLKSSSHFCVGAYVVTQSVLLSWVPIASIDAWGSLSLARHVPCLILPALQRQIHQEWCWSVYNHLLLFMGRATAFPSIQDSPVVARLTPPRVRHPVAQDGWKEREKGGENRSCHQNKGLMLCSLGWSGDAASQPREAVISCQHLSHSSSLAYRISDLVS